MLKQELEKQVNIKQITIAKTKNTGASKGFGFATLNSKEDLYKLIDLKETPIFVDCITHKK
jgi:RNA recognition motif-containing protein